MNVYIFRNKIDLSFIKIFPGDWVVVKPNLIKESIKDIDSEWEATVTSPKIIKLVCEYVCQKLKSKGKVSICDAPQTDSSFIKIAKKLDLFEIAKQCSDKYGIIVEVIDLRNEEWINEDGIITQRRKLSGDPNGSITFNLGENSLFFGHSGEGYYYGADYDSKIVNQHHIGRKQEYLINATPIMADVFINLPKMKVHKKTGVTLSLKNLVGINADKNWLPHHSEGSPKNGGDQFPDTTLKNYFEQIGAKFIRKLALSMPYFGIKIAKKLRKEGLVVFGNENKVIRSGNWYGNNTTWRMVLDLNRCLLYGNKNGTIRKENPKRYYSVIDGIVGMERMGPMGGDPINSNIVIGGSDPIAVDMVAARVMGFDWRKIPMIREASNLSALPISSIKPENISVISDISEWNGKFLEIENHNFLNFKPNFGWKNHIEYKNKL